MPDKLEGKIEFKGVYFKYPVNLDSNSEEEENPLLEKGKYILKNVSFLIKPGQKVALVGFSGSGKSTVIKLLERFYEPEKGSVLIDGIDIQDYNLYELRKKIGLVGQEPILFRRSIYENIKYGKLDASRQSVMQAAKEASIQHLFNVNNNLSKIEDAKSMISGGEKQRVSIARAFLKDPKILLLDEPTSALDKKNEIEITNSLDRLMKGRTTFIVTHRLDSIKNADVILVFENGRLVQKGTHEELIKVNGQYKFLFAFVALMLSAIGIQAEEKTIWKAHSSGILSKHIWAPEMHKIGGAWYMFFAAGASDNIWAIRPYVLKCDGDPYNGNWTECGQMQASSGDTESFRGFSLDMTYFENNGKHYVNS